MENIKTNFKQNMHFAYAAKIGETGGTMYCLSEYKISSREAWKGFASYVTMISLLNFLNDIFSDWQKKNLHISE